MNKERRDTHLKFTEQQISKMASPISQTEEEKCKNAIRMVRDAMEKLNYTDDGKEIRSYVADTYSYSLDLRQRYSDKKIKLLVQGSTLIKQIFPPKAMWMLQLFWNQHSHLHIEKVLLGNRMALLQEHFLLLN